VLVFFWFCRPPRHFILVHLDGASAPNVLAAEEAVVLAAAV
jgi:hypothetical protein